LQQVIEHDQVKKLLSEGKTDLLEKFVSMRTRRAFKAYLSYDAEAGKVSFAFEPSKYPKKGGAPTTRALAKAAGKTMPGKKTPAAKKAAAKDSQRSQAQSPAQNRCGQSPQRGLGRGHRPRGRGPHRGDEKAVGLHQGQWLARPQRQTHHPMRRQTQNRVRQRRCGDV
jgi:hypothetical protein